ncbi:MAG: tyrosine-type recombinase/integrase [Bacillota bacterium]
MEHAAFYQQNKELHIKLKKQEKIKGRKVQEKRAIFPPYVEEFGRHLEDCNYSAVTIESYKIQIRKITKDIRSKFNISFDSISDFIDISEDFLITFENYIFQRIEKKELTPQSAHHCMKAYKAFMHFLYNRVPYKYEIPRNLLFPTRRANLFIEQKDIIHLAESIKQNKNLIRKTRSYALLLLYIETGCRPIEASNLLVTDINFTEKTIRLYSIKSGTRKLKLDSFVIKAMKHYMIIRESLGLKNDYFFVKNNGERTNTKYLTLQIYIENKKAFGQIKVHARALRHTYVTNAFENNNVFQDISDTLGHKHWVSTLHYQHKSVERLLKNSLPHNPIPNFIEREVIEDAH